MKYLEEIEGVGPKTISLLNKIGIYDINDLIEYYPKRYNVIKRSNMDFVSNGDKVVVDGILEGHPTIVNLSSKLKKIIFRISNSTNIYNINVYNQVYLCKELKVGESIIVIGKYDKIRNSIIASEIRKGVLPEKEQIEPVYYTTEGLNRKSIVKFISLVLESDINAISYLPNYLVDRYSFPDKKWSISQIHFPKSGLLYKKALQRLKYEEFFLYLLRIQYLKLRMSSDKAIERTFDENKLTSFIDSLDYVLTKDQMETVMCIKDDMISSRRMNRLVQGDVGSGKTIVSFIAGYINYLSGYQTALMVPTEILANQHYDDAVKLFSDRDVRVELLTSNINKREKDKILKKLENGEIDFIIGTQSLIQDKVKYYNLGLIITDEQHRFGVNQRNELKNKGSFPDVLSMSATPIPRTYALTIYGDMDVSSIKTKPVGRKEIITYYKKEKDLMEVLKMIKEQLDLGHQIYIIAPSIDGGNDDKNVLNLKEKMQVAFGKVAKIDAIYGRLENDTKSKIMKNFEDGKTDILISTTVIEVGVNVPNASMIVIFNANMFGLSTLHQLRGRVGRSDIQSYCILLSKDNCDRLKLLEQTSDGFEVSEYDFKSRGEGDLFGIRQSGQAQLKLADIKRDFDLLLRVREDVGDFLNNNIKNEQYSYIFDYLNGIGSVD